MQAWRARSARRRAGGDAVLDLRYAPAPRATLDFFRAAAGAPTVAFFHGGYWQWNSKEDFAFIADGLLAASLNVAVIGYTLAPDATLDGIVSEARAAVAALVTRLSYLGAGDELLAGGWSAGGHLAAMVLGEPGVRAGFALSAIFDLAPLMETSLNDALRLDEAMARRNSPLHLPCVDRPFDIAVGGAELPALQRQSEAFAAARRAAGAPGTFVTYPGRDHYTMLEALADPRSAVVAAVRDLACF